MNGWEPLLGRLPGLPLLLLVVLRLRQGEGEGVSFRVAELAAAVGRHPVRVRRALGALRGTVLDYWPAGSRAGEARARVWRLCPGCARHAADHYPVAAPWNPQPPGCAMEPIRNRSAADSTGSGEEWSLSGGSTALPTPAGTGAPARAMTDAEREAIVGVAHAVTGRGPRPPEWELVAALLAEGLTLAELAAGAELALRHWRPTGPARRIGSLHYCRPIWRELMAGRPAPVPAVPPPAAPRRLVKARELQDWERLELTMQVAQLPAGQQPAARRALLLRWGVWREEPEGE